ncbi:MAG: hypothetical protein L0I79_06095 [Atopostipes sp.]|nr:hypothetical protein [Atopostipes sp.]
MLTHRQTMTLLKIIIHFIVFISFTFILNEWALGLAVSVFSRCFINKLAKNTYSSINKFLSKES